MKKLIKAALEKFLDDLNTDNTNINEEDEIKLIRTISSIVNKDERMSKLKACEHLEISRSKFDDLVTKGFIPKGRKEEGFKELSWSRFDLDLYKMKYMTQE